MAIIRVINIAVEKYEQSGRDADKTIYYIKQQLDKYYEYMSYLNSQESDDE